VCGLLGMPLQQALKTGMTRRKKLKKPSELLNLYSEKLNLGLEKKLSPLAFELTFHHRSLHIAHISGYVMFRTRLMLEFDEIIIQERNHINKLKYRYHAMDKDKKLIFRHDNVPHFPKIKTHPHHKHTRYRVTESQSPGLLEVIDEVETLIIKEKH